MHRQQFWFYIFHLYFVLNLCVPVYTCYYGTCKTLSGIFNTLKNMLDHLPFKEENFHSLTTGFDFIIIIIISFYFIFCDLFLT